MTEEGRIIDNDGKVVGAAVRVRGGFMFFSCDPDFNELEARVFRRAEMITRCVTEIVHAQRGALPQLTRSVAMSCGFVPANVTRRQTLNRPTVRDRREDASNSEARTQKTAASPSSPECR